jgi:hypothetical protein
MPSTFQNRVRSDNGTSSDNETLVQWFPTGLPQRDVRDAAKFWITALLLMFYFIWYRKIVIFSQLGVPPDFFKDLRGASNQKRLKNTALVYLEN